MSLLIKNGEIITATERYVADICCENETISRIEPDITPSPGAEVIDAKGKYVFPGFIDPHVHIYLPFMGTYAKDTHATASKAALVGGTTTFVEMICPARPDEPMAGFELWLGKAQGNSACDFTFHMGVTRYDDAAEKQFTEIVKRGLSSFKIFLAYKGAFGITDEELYKALRLAKKLGVITTAHCENADLVLELQKRLLAEGKTGPEWHHESRPPLVEAEGVHHLMTFAEMHDAHVYIVHLSCDEALRQAAAAKYRSMSGSKHSSNISSLTKPTPSVRTSRAPSSSCPRRSAKERIRTYCGTACAMAWSARWLPTTRHSILCARKIWAGTTLQKSQTEFLHWKIA